MNINEILNTIKGVAKVQRGVHSVYDGDVYTNWNSAETKYGSVNVGLQDVTYNSNLVTYTVVLYYGDRLIQNNQENANSIYTDGVRVLQSTINTLNNMDGIDISTNPVYSPFEQKFMDYLAGVYTTVEVECESELGLCTIDSYDYESDKDKLIEYLIKKINEYREADEELSNLLRTILYKLVGDNDFDVDKRYQISLLFDDIANVEVPDELSVSSNGANFDSSKGCKPSSDGKYLSVVLDNAFEDGIKAVKLHMSFDSRNIEATCDIEHYSNGLLQRSEKIYNEGATKDVQVFELRNIEGNEIRIKRNGTIIYITKVEVIY